MASAGFPYSRMTFCHSRGFKFNGSSISKLDPYVDKEGLLRVGGRTRKSSHLTEQEKHPAIIPKNCHLGRLLILNAHEKSPHLSWAYALTTVRQDGYWLIAGRRTAKDLIGQCVRCKKLRGRASQQQMGELPAERIELAPPFTNTGIDCFSPFSVKERRTELKRYGLLFTRLYSRAVHIEVLDNLTTDS
ncbi:uncharacterized protein [Watersipora subatra]|uniref:uncharacterized protein n=1 Tax=Watersipora subatra TaxID=2589382 RepID=UPI00355B38F5